MAHRGFINKISLAYWNILCIYYLKNFDCIFHFNAFNQKNLFDIFCYKLSARLDNIQFLSKNTFFT